MTEYKVNQTINNAPEIGDVISGHFRNKYTIVSVSYEPDCIVVNTVDSIDSLKRKQFFFYQLDDTKEYICKILRKTDYIWITLHREFLEGKEIPEAMKEFL